MSRRFVVGDGERVVISVTPTAWGVRLPAFTTLMSLVLVIAAAVKIAFVHRHEALALLVLCLPPALWWATRLVRWRSHKVHVTTEQVAVVGGVLRRESFRIAIDQILTLEVRQRLHQRLRRQGIIELVTKHDTVTLGPVRHPDALARMIEQQRRRQHPQSVSYDALFEPTIPETTWDRNPFAPR